LNFETQKRINRPRFYYESGWVRLDVPITYRAYCVRQCL